MKIGVRRANLNRMLYEANDPNCDNLLELVDDIARIFPKGLVEPLKQLVNGPVADGDLISPADQKKLLEMGIAIRICNKGQQGYTGSKYLGYSILRAINNIQYDKLRSK